MGSSLDSQIMGEIRFTLNGSPQSLEVSEQMPLLWAIRDVLGLKGTKFGCGKGLCGSCTVHMNGVAVRSCQLPMIAVSDQEITTIEGLADGDDLHPVQEAWVQEDVPQCGYCQVGQIMTASAFLRGRDQAPSNDEIDAAMTGNLCRCGTYPRIKKAIKRAAEIGIEKGGLK